jgi:hypothetical protein
MPDHAFLLVRAQQYVANFLQLFQELPPRQEPAWRGTSRRQGVPAEPEAGLVHHRLGDGEAEAANGVPAAVCART